MDPVTISAVTAAASSVLKVVLSRRDKPAISTEAGAILRREPDSLPRIRRLFDDTRTRLRSTWAITMSMTITLFALFVAMAVAAAVTGIISASATYPIVFGGISASSLLTAILWKPYEKAFHTTVTTQRLEMVLIGLEEEWRAVSLLDDLQVRSDRIGAANRATLEQIEKIADSNRSGPIMILGVDMINRLYCVSHKHNWESWQFTSNDECIQHRRCRTCGRSDESTRIEHEWVGTCRCRRCGVTRDANHSWSGCHCTVCDKRHCWKTTYTEAEVIEKCSRCGQETRRERTTCPECGGKGEVFMGGEYSPLHFIQCSSCSGSGWSD